MDYSNMEIDKLVKWESISDYEPRAMDVMALLFAIVE